MKSFTLLAVSFFAGFSASAAATSDHAFIGINLHGRVHASVPVPAEMMAGAVPQKHWNNFGFRVMTDTSAALHDAEGRTTSASILMYPVSDEAWKNQAEADAGHEGDDLLVKAFYQIGDKNGERTVTFKIYDLPALPAGETYSVLVYSVGRKKTGEAALDVVVQGRRAYLWSQSDEEWNSARRWLRANAARPEDRAVANYARIDGVIGGAALPLEITVTGASSQAVVNAIQIVKVVPAAR
jgi:hypothetical protein